MRTAGLLALGLLVAVPLFAQGEAEGARQPIAADSNWSIDRDAGCVIAAGWDGDVRIEVKPDFAFPDEHDIEVSHPAFKKFAPGELATVRYGAAGEIAGRGEYSAMGHLEGKLKTYVTDADDELLEAFATTNSFQFYRDDVLELELDVTGFAEALAAMRACEATPLDEGTKM